MELLRLTNCFWVLFSRLSICTLVHSSSKIGKKLNEQCFYKYWGRGVGSLFFYSSTINVDLSIEGNPKQFHIPNCAIFFNPLWDLDIMKKACLFENRQKLFRSNPLIHYINYMHINVMCSALLWISKFSVF